MIGPILLTGCASPGFNGCNLLPLKEYPAAFNMRLADELDAAPMGAAWPDAVADYAGLRDAVRACRGAMP